MQRTRYEKLLKVKTDEDFNSGNLQLLRSSLNHHNVIQISAKLGNYDYEACTPFARFSFTGCPYADAPLVKRPPVEIENGIYYEGEWVKVEGRHSQQ